jgi:hypothetical protein
MGGQFGKMVFLIVAVLMSRNLYGAAPDLRSGPRVVATVNGLPIYQSELNLEKRYRIEQEDVAIEALIERELLVSAYRASVNESEWDTAKDAARGLIQRSRKESLGLLRYGSLTREIMREVCAEEGFSFATYERSRQRAFLALEFADIHTHRSIMMVHRNELCLAPPRRLKGIRIEVGKSLTYVYDDSGLRFQPCLFTDDADARYDRLIEQLRRTAIIHRIDGK